MNRDQSLDPSGAQYQVEMLVVRRALLLRDCGDELGYYAAIPNLFAWASVRAGAAIKGNLADSGSLP